MARERIYCCFVYSALVMVTLCYGALEIVGLLLLLLLILITDKKAWPWEERNSHGLMCISKQLRVVSYHCIRNKRSK